MWKIIKQFPDYEAHTSGKIRNIRTGRVMKARIDKGGYKIIDLRLNKKRYSLLVHRLIAMAFISNPSNKPNVNHKNGNTLDNRKSNLEWCYQKYNITHSRKITKNGAVISRKKILNIVSTNPNITKKELIKLLVANCR